MAITCSVCGLTYVPSLAEDRASHRIRHGQVVRTLRPRPLRIFIERLKRSSDPEHVTSLSASWLQNELYFRARMFRREFDYDFIRWSPNGAEETTVHGFLFNDDTNTFGHGAIAGGGVFRWRKFQDAPSGWTFDWVWVSPDARRKGILTRRWPKFTERFGNFYLMPPLSAAMTNFAEKGGHSLPRGKP